MVKNYLLLQGLISNYRAAHLVRRMAMAEGIAAIVSKPVLRGDNEPLRVLRRILPLRRCSHEPVSQNWFTSRPFECLASINQLMPPILKSRVKSNTRGKIAYLLKGGRRQRVDQGGPTEFLYGCLQLQKAGHDVTLIEDKELSLDIGPGFIWRAINHLSFVLSGIPLWTLFRLMSRCNLNRLNAFEIIVVTTTTFGVCLGLLRRLGMLRAKVLFIAMGLVEKSTPKRIVVVYRWLFGNDTTVLALSNADANWLTAKLGKQVSSIPFGVDTSFWYPSSSVASVGTDGYVLSMGNDLNRDYHTLIDCWKENYPQLRIITRLNIPLHSNNVIRIVGDWHQQELSDKEIRRLIQNALFVVLPLKNTIQPSGQSACLQAMACGKAVIITDFPGLWNRELLRTGDTCIIAGPPGGVTELQLAVERLIVDVSLPMTIGTNARRVVESSLGVGDMARAIASELDRLAS